MDTARAGGYASREVLQKQPPPFARFPMGQFINEDNDDDDVEALGIVVDKLAREAAVAVTLTTPVDRLLVKQRYSTAASVVLLFVSVVDAAVVDDTAKTNELTPAKQNVTRWNSKAVGS
jgi:hypothetical protein